MHYAQNTVFFLASDSVKSITGVNIPVDQVPYVRLR